MRNFLSRFLPLLASLWLGAIFFCAYLIGPSHELPSNYGDLALISKGVHSSAAQARNSDARLTWCISITLVLASLAVVAWVCCGIFRRLQDHRLRTHGIVLILVSAVILTALIARPCFQQLHARDYVPSTVLGILCMRAGIFGALIYVGDGLAAFTCLLIAVTACFVCEDSVDIRGLEEKTRDLDRLLWVSAAVLTACVFEIASLSSWPITAFFDLTHFRDLVDTTYKLNQIGVHVSLEPEKWGVDIRDLPRLLDLLDAMRNLARTLVIVIGLGLTSLLCAIFSIAFLRLKKRATDHIRRMSLEMSSVETSMFLQEHGFRPNAAAKILRASLAAGPFLFGIIAFLTGLFVPRS